MRSPLPVPTPRVATPKSPSLPRRMSSEAGKVGLALLMWMLGVPGIAVLAYLILA